MATINNGTTAPRKRLITSLGVLTVLGLVTGIAAIFLPFASVYYPHDDQIGLLPFLAELADGKGLDLEQFFQALLFAPLLLAVPISAGYVGWLITGGLAPWAWRTGYILAVLAGITLLSSFGGLGFLLDAALDVESVVFALFLLALLALAAWLVVRNLRVGLPHALNALIALQALYIGCALPLIVLFFPSGGFVIIVWDIGALFALLTVMIYVAQMVLISLRKGRKAAAQPQAVTQNPKMKELLVTFLVFLILLGCSEGDKSPNQHDQKPQQASGQDFKNAEAMIKKIYESDYYKQLQKLESFVSGKQVVSSITGNSGFILILSDNGWAAAFRDKDAIGSAFGTGEPDEKIRRLISSKEYGDASGPLSENVIYANEYVDIKQEVAKSHGNTIKSLAYGYNTFNYAFVGGRELDFKLVKDKNNKPAVRVFWEQW